MTTVLDLTCTGNLSDASASGHTVGVGGDAFVDTDALRLDGAGDYVYVPHHSDFEFGSDDFEISFDLKASSLSGTNAIFAKYETGGTFWELTYSSSGLRFLAKNGGTTLYDQQGGSLTTGILANIKIKRVGNTLSVLKDNAQIFSGSLTGSFPNPLGALYIGYAFYTTNGSIYWNGWVDNFRIERGSTPPPPSPEIEWREGKTIVSDTAPEGPLVFINTLTPSTYATLSMASLQSGTIIPVSYHELDITEYGLPADTRAVLCGGLLVCTMGQNTQIGEMRVYLGGACISGNYTVQSEAVNAGGGFRTPFSTWATVDGGLLKFAWWCSSPQPFSYPSYASFALNMKIQAALVPDA